METNNNKTFSWLLFLFPNCTVLSVSLMLVLVSMCWMAELEMKAFLSSPMLSVQTSLRMNTPNRCALPPDVKQPLPQSHGEAKIEPINAPHAYNGFVCSECQDLNIKKNMQTSGALCHQFKDIKDKIIAFEIVELV